MQTAFFIPIVGARIQDRSGEPVVATLRYDPKCVVSPEILNKDNQHAICMGFRNMVDRRAYHQFTREEAEAFIMAYYGEMPEEILVECQSDT